VMSLFSGRSSTVYHNISNSEELLSWIDEIDAGYIVIGPFERDAELITPILKKLDPYPDVVFKNEDFEMLKIVD